MTGKMKKPAAALLVLSLLALSACSSVKRELGVGRNSPDEFTVVKRAPLTLPPDYALRPPMDPSLPPPSKTETVEQAKEVVLGKDDEKKTAKENKADSALMSKLGTSDDNADIRKIIDEENGIIAIKSTPVTEKLIFWDSEEAAPSLEHMPSSIVDPAKEKERLEKNKEEGKPVNEGKVPTIEKKQSTIDKLF